MGPARAKLIDEDGCQIRMVHLERVEQARKDAISEREVGTTLPDLQSAG